MFTFYIENHEPFGSLTKNCQKLDKNKNIVSTFSTFVVYKSAVSTIQKSNYAQYKRATMQNVSMFVSEGLYLDIYFLIFQ